jgi:hypothetical protein
MHTAQTTQWHNMLNTVHTTRHCLSLFAKQKSKIKIFLVLQSYWCHRSILTSLRKQHFSHFLFCTYSKSCMQYCRWNDFTNKLLVAKKCQQLIVVTNVYKGDQACTVYHHASHQVQSCRINHYIYIYNVII